jgi:branched-chain amino acid transport system ATP-binding protein
MEKMLEFRAVSASYGQGSVLKTLALRVEAGCVTSLLGPNGAGKTTALRVAAGLLPVTAGSVFVGGEDVTGLSARERAKRGICLIPEGRGVFPNLTVSENLRLHGYLKSMPPDEREDMVFTIFPRLRDRRRQQAGTLSGGEQQMLALARALTTNPQILLIDELSMGLAPNLVEELIAHVVKLSEDGRTVLLVEQLADFALEISRHVYVLARGEVVASGRPGDVRESLFDVYVGE